MGCVLDSVAPIRDGNVLALDQNYFPDVDLRQLIGPLDPIVENSCLNKGPSLIPYSTDPLFYPEFAATPKFRWAIIQQIVSWGTALFYKLYLKIILFLLWPAKAANIRHFLPV